MAKLGWVALVLVVGAGSARADEGPPATQAPGRATSASPDASDEAAARLAALPVGRLIVEHQRPSRRTERELRATVDAALRIYATGATGGAGDGPIPAAAPADTVYLVAALLDSQTLTARRGGALANRADSVRLAAAIACGLLRAPASWGELLARERGISSAADPLRVRADALAASLPALIDAAGALARAHGAVILAAVPTHVGTLRALGELELATGHVEAAADLLGRFVQREPEATEARMALAYALLAAGRTDDGEAALGEVVRREPRLEGTAAATRRRAAVLRRLPDATPERIGGLPVGEAVALVRDLDEAGFREQALGAARELARSNPQDPDVVAVLGGLLLEAGRVADWYALSLREPLASTPTPALVEVMAVGRFMAAVQAAGSIAVSRTDADETLQAARAAVGRWASDEPDAADQASALLDVLPALVRARAAGDDMGVVAREVSASVTARHPTAFGRRLGVLALVGAGLPEEAIAAARVGLAEGGPRAALELADLLTYSGVTSGDRRPLEEALALVEGAEARLEVGGDPCRPGTCGDRGRARATRAQLLGVLSLIAADGDAERATDAVRAARQAWAMLDPMDPAEREAAVAAQLLIARAAVAAGDLDAARVAVERARRDDPAAPDVELFAAVLALLDRDLIGSRDLLERALLLGPNRRLELAVRKWRLFVADQLTDRAGFVAQLRALGDLWDVAAPPGLPPELESVVVTGTTNLNGAWEPPAGFVARVGLDQHVVVAPTQRQLTRQVVRSLLAQLAALEGGGDPPEAPPASSGGEGVR